MENQRTFLIIALMAISALLYQKWIEFSAPPQANIGQQQNIVDGAVPSVNTVTPIGSTAIPLSTPSQTTSLDGEVPSTPSNLAQIAPTVSEASAVSQSALITVTTDLVIAKINPLGGVIESLELLKEPIALDQPEQGFPLLKKSPKEIFLAQDGLLVSQQTGPNHTQTQYQVSAYDYQLGAAEQIAIPLTWTADNGVQYTKVYTFKQDSYVIDIDYKVNNNTSQVWNGYLYAQFSRTEPENTGGGFGQLPSYTGGAIYTVEEKYEKIEFDDIVEENLNRSTESGWVAMLQHYFVGAWIPQNGGAKKFYSSASTNTALPIHRIGYKTDQPTTITAGQSGTISTSIYLGPKEQKRLKKIQQDSNINGLALTVDYGFLTFIADPLFTALSWIHSVVGNWGWAIIILTILIKALFYPLSAASYKSMAGMKKLQPRIKTLKERYKDDKQKFQMEMMALYKKEKINPAGGCLPILIQIPVFIALYWALLESVEIRQAPFALWLQDLSAPDPYYVLPVLMGLSMWLQQKLNPAAMDDIQKKVMTIMPIALTFLFLTFPQGLVLYWVVNNVLSMAQQWFINRKYAV